MDWLDWSFWQWLGAALALVVAAIGIKVAVSFDINRFLEGQRKRKERRLQALCPHTELTFGQSGEIFVESQFNSPPGTLAFYCNWCGIIVSDRNRPSEISMYWGTNPDAWKKAYKRFDKAYSKFHGI